MTIKQQAAYVQAQLDAEIRLRNGEQQVICPVCNKWVWPHQLDPKIKRIISRNVNKPRHEH